MSGATASVALVGAPMAAGVAGPAMAGLIGSAGLVGGVVAPSTGNTRLPRSYRHGGFTTIKRSNLRLASHLPQLRNTPPSKLK